MNPLQQTATSRIGRADLGEVQNQRQNAALCEGGLAAGAGGRLRTPPSRSPPACRAPVPCDSPTAAAGSILHRTEAVMRSPSSTTLLDGAIFSVIIFFYAAPYSRDLCIRWDDLPAFLPYSSSSAFCSCISRTTQHQKEPWILRTDELQMGLQ